MGISAGIETRVNTHTQNSQGAPRIAALSGGGWVVAWISDGQDGSGLGVYQQAYSANGTPSGGENRVNSNAANNQSPATIAALANGGWIVAWDSMEQDGSGTDVYQQAYLANGTPAGSETRVNTYTLNSQSVWEIVALIGGGWVVTWQSDGQDGSNLGVYQKVYSADGNALGGDVRVNSYTANIQMGPRATALSNGGWVVTWMSFGQDGAGSGIYQQAYSADGMPLGSESLVNSCRLKWQQLQQITALSSGGWVVAWQSEGQDGSAHGVYQQAYFADGSPAGGEVQVNSYTDGEQWGVHITALTGGGWVVTWGSESQDSSGSDSGVYQQVYAADGTPVGGETRVNTYSQGNQRNPEIEALPGGGWVVVWVSDFQDGNRLGVYQQIYAGNGTPFGGEMRVNSYTIDAQYQPQIAALSDGRWVVTWMSNGQDGSELGVYQRMFSIIDEAGETMDATRGNDVLN